MRRGREFGMQINIKSLVILIDGWLMSVSCTMSAPDTYVAARHFFCCGIRMRATSFSVAVDVVNTAGL